MITITDVEKLAGLSRLSLTELEKQSFLKEIDAILGYVSHINSIVADETLPDYRQVNVLREDQALHNSGEFTESLLANAPLKEGSYVKVKKILE